MVDGSEYVVIDNLLHGLPNPSMMDAKLGAVTWTHEHFGPKVEEQKKRSAETTSGSLGFRLSGAVLKDSDGTVRENWSKLEKVLSITPGNIHIEFAHFVTRDGVLNKDAARELRRRTQEITDWFNTQRLFKFYAASVLYVNGTHGD